MDRQQTTRYGITLALLSLLFLLRVVGQLVAGIWQPSLLPAFEKWDSGLLPYPLLLTAQLGVLALLGRGLFDFARGSGALVRPRPRAARSVRRWAWIYAAVMAVRYVLTQALVPEGRWFGGAIPIAFHFVLAGILLIWARYQRQLSAAASTAPGPPEDRRVGIELILVHCIGGTIIVRANDWEECA